MQESFKFFIESTHENIEDLKRMIQNPDPERVKQYGGTAYVDMLKKKLERMEKIVAIKDHLSKSKLSGEYRGPTSQLPAPKSSDEEFSSLSDNEIIELAKERGLEDQVKVLNGKIYNRGELEQLLSIATPVYGKSEDGESEDLEQQILDLIDQGKKEEAKELNFKMYDIDPDKYKELYYKITGNEEDGEALKRLTRQDHPGMVKYRDKDLPKLSKGAQNTLSGIYDKITKDKEEDAQDRCKRKADQVYGKKTSAYKSGAIVRCRKGKIWKKK